LIKSRLNAEKTKDNSEHKKKSKVNPATWIPNQTGYNQNKDIEILEIMQ